MRNDFIPVPALLEDVITTGGSSLKAVKALELLNQQVGVLETMTALDFLEFRNFPIHGQIAGHCGIPG